MMYSTPWSSNCARFWIGGLRGFEYLGRVNRIKNTTRPVFYHAVNNRVSLYRLLASGRIQFALDYGTPAQRHIKLAHESGFFELPLEIMQVHMAIPKSKAQAQQLMLKMEALLAEHI